MEKDLEKRNMVALSSCLRHIRNHIYVYVSVFLIICLLVCVYVFIPRNRAVLTVDNTEEEVLSAFSEKFGVDKDYMNMLDSSNLWYDEYIYANVREGLIVHHHDNTEDTIGYDNVQRKETIKKLKNKNESTLNALNAIVEKFSDIRQRVIKEYSDELDNISDTSDKRLSYIYNGIVGDPIGHYLIAYKNDGIKYITRDDFPQYTINRKRLVEVLNRKDLDTSKNLYDFLVDEGVLHKEDLVFGYVDFRKNKLFINDTVYIRGTLGGDLYGKYYDTICQRPGMVLYNKEIRSWLDLVNNNEEMWCNPDVGKLKLLKVKAIEEPFPIWLLLLGMSCGVVIGLFLYFIRGYVKTKKDSINIEKEPAFVDQVISVDNKETKFYEKLKTLFNRKWEENDLFDLLINEFAIKEIKVTKETISNNKDNAEKYRNFKNVSSERELLRLLESMHRDNNKFPAITSLKSLYEKSSESENSKNKKIEKILGEIEKVAGSKDSLRVYFSDIYEKSEEYGKIQKLIKSSENVYEVLNKGIERLKASSQYMNDFVSFASIFNGDFSKGESYAESFSGSKKISDDAALYMSNILKKDSLAYWDRLSLILCSVKKVALPLMKAWKKTPQFANGMDEIENNIKMDMLQLYTSRIFINYLDNKYTIEQYNNFVSNDFKNSVKDYNKGNPDFVVNIDEQNVKAYNDAMSKIKSSQLFIENMWESFVCDFVNHVEKNEDKSWFFEHIINIAIHASEYVDAVRSNRMAYCDNYKMLISGFKNLSIGGEIREYKHENPLNSSPYANRVYKWAEELNVKHLKILVNKYYIMP